MTRTIPKDNFYILQVSDAYRMAPPLPMETAKDRGRARWSHAYRPMPHDGGYLPIVPMAKAVLDTGVRGWVSLEVFDGGPTAQGSADDLHGFAHRAIGCPTRLLQQAGAQV